MHGLKNLEVPKAPCVFELLKWKADEFVVDGLRWRDIVSFAGHPLQAWSRVMSRCLLMLVSFLIDQGIGLGFAKMQGVRDQLQAAARMGAITHETEFNDEDMADMFQEIPATDVKWAVQWALNAVRAKHRATNLSFSASKESNHLDRIGRSTAPGYTVVREECVSRFVDFDLDNNVLFTAGGVILAQGGKGVPIGGFISAQAAEIWAIWKDHCVFSDEHRSAATSRWQHIIDAPLKEWEDLPPPTVHTSVSVSVAVTSDFSVAPRPAATIRVQVLAMASPQSHLGCEPAL